MAKSERSSWPLSINYWALCSISHCWPLPLWNSSPPDFNETWLGDALEVTGVLFKAFLPSRHTFPSWVSHSKGFSSHHWFQIRTSSVHIFTQQTYDLTWKLKLKREVTVLSWWTFQYLDWWQSDAQIRILSHPRYDNYAPVLALTDSAASHHPVSPGGLQISSSSIHLWCQHPTQQHCPSA